MNRDTGYCPLYRQLHAHRLISRRRAQRVGQVARDHLGDALGIGHDGDHVLWRQDLQHDGALWGCPSLCDHRFSEQRVQIPARRVQLQGMGLETCIIEQVPDDALLKTGALCGRGQEILELLKLLAYALGLFCELALEGGETTLGYLEIALDGGQRRLQFMAGQVEEFSDEQTQFLLRQCSGPRLGLLIPAVETVDDQRGLGCDGFDELDLLRRVPPLNTSFGDGKSANQLLLEKQGNHEQLLDAKICPVAGCAG